MRTVIACFFGHWRWVRRLLGGHWECWWIDSPVNAYLWLNDVAPGEHLPLARGTPEIEDWP